MQESQPETKSELHPKVPLDEIRKRIEHQGCPLEFHTAHAFRQLGFRTVQGPYFSDSITEKPREIDVIASLREQVEQKASVEIAYVIECKWSRECPWVILTSTEPQILPQQAVRNAIATSLGSSILNGIREGLNILTSPQFAGSEVEGFNARRACPKGRDDRELAFTAISSVVAGAFSLCAKSDSDRAHVPLQPAPDIEILIHFPIIVIEGELFEAKFNPDSENIEVRPIRWGRVNWPGSEHKGSTASVDIITRESLREYISRHKPGASELLNHVSTQLRILLQARRAKDLDSLLRVLSSPKFESLPSWVHEFWHHQESFNIGGAVGIIP